MPHNPSCQAAACTKQQFAKSAGQASSRCHAEVHMRPSLLPGWGCNNTCWTQGCLHIHSLQATNLSDTLNVPKKLRSAYRDVND